MNKPIRYRLIAVSLLVLFFNSVFSQDFSWIKGTNQVDIFGDYGTTGVGAPTNNPGGRYGAYTWKDAAGNFWLYGGMGFDHISNYGNLSDLWKYSVSTNQWTYLKGSNVINQPSLHGTLGIPSPSNKPGGRHSGAAWADASGNLWLMGGYGHGGTPSLGLGYINDLWKYNITTNEWTWINGNNVVYAQGEYGTQGVPSTTNTPGGRMGATAWTDASGKFWLFGGYGQITTSVNIGSLDDVWNYDVTTNEWTWVKGTNLLDQNGIYGTLGTAAAANNPGARQESTGWLDGNNFWIIGGEGWDQAGTATGFLNDMWKYNMSTNEWTWTRGSNTINQSGTYGTQGTGSTANMPGSRAGSFSWKDAVGNMWLFGGKGFAGPSVSAIGDLNDLWKYKPATDEWTWVKGTSLVGQHGIYGTLTVPALTNLPGARSKHAGWIDASNDLYIFGGSGQAAAGVGGSLNDLWKYMNCYISPITMTITSNDSTICTGETTSLTAAGSANYLWLHNLAIVSYVLISPPANTTYTVLTADSKGCKYQATFTQTVEACAGINTLDGKAMRYTLYPNPSNGEFAISMPGIDKEAQLLVYNALGQWVFGQTLLSDETQIKPMLAKGIYHYQIRQSGQIKGSGKLAIE